MAYLDVQQVPVLEYSAIVHPRVFACLLAVRQACSEAFDVVTHADRAGDGVAGQTGSGQLRLRFRSVLGSTANHVALPGGRRREAAGASLLRGVLGRAASASARVFSNRASTCLLACLLAVRQACSEAFDVVTHADRAGDGVAGQTGSGQLRLRFRS